MQLLLFGKRHDVEGPTKKAVARLAAVVLVVGALGENFLGRVVVVMGQREILQIVAALTSPTSLTGGLHGGKQQADQGGDDRDHHEQFDKRESADESGFQMACPSHVHSNSPQGGVTRVRNAPSHAATWAPHAGPRNSFLRTR